MKRILSISLVTALTALNTSNLNAAIFNDAVGENIFNGILDITSVEVNNTATDLIFKINLAGDPVTTDWGKYMIAIDSAPGGDSAGNGWSRPISMAGMDYWVGSWADWGTGAEIRNYSGSWTLQSATYNPNPDSLSFSLDSSSVTIQFAFAGLGLGVGSTFLFDVYTSGGGGSDGAIDALANPNQTINDWGVAYDTASPLSYTIPEPGSLTLLGLAGGVMLLRLARRR